MHSDSFRHNDGDGGVCSKLEEKSGMYMECISSVVGSPRRS